MDDPSAPAPGTRVSIAELVRREREAAEAAARPSEPAPAPEAVTPAASPAAVGAPTAAPAPVPTHPTTAPSESPGSPAPREEAPRSPGDPDAVPVPPTRTEPARSAPEAAATPTAPQGDLPVTRAAAPTTLPPLPDVPEVPDVRDVPDADVPEPTGATPPSRVEPVDVPTFTPPPSRPPSAPDTGRAAPTTAPPASATAGPSAAPAPGFRFTQPATSREALVASHVKALRADPEGTDRRCWPPELVRTVPAATALQKGTRPALVVFYDDRAKASKLAAADLWPVVLEVEPRVDLVLVDLTPGGPRALTDDERRLVRRYYLGYVPTIVVLGSDRVPRLLKSERVDPALVRAAATEAK